MHGERRRLNATSCGQARPFRAALPKNTPNPANQGFPNDVVGMNDRAVRRVSLLCNDATSHQAVNATIRRFRVYVVCRMTNVYPGAIA